MANTGTAPLQTGLLTLPAGFSLVEGLSTSILPGRSDSFTVRLDMAKDGIKRGEIRFFHDDAPPGTLDIFNFAVIGLVAPGSPGDTHDMSGEAALLEGDAADLFGDAIFNFGADDTLRILHLSGISDFLFTGNEVRLAVAGEESTPLIFDGDFTGGRFFALATPDGEAVDLFFAPFLADDALEEGRRLSEAEVNGNAHPAALTGDGERRFVVTLSDKAVADKNNALGVYEVDAEGNIVDARILFGNVKADPTASIGFDQVEAGHRLGFFIVHGGVDGPGEAAFANAAGEPANVADGRNIGLTVNGRRIAPDTVFHAFSAGLNADGLVHARNGADPSGTGVRIAFEDLPGGGDRDFQDVVFRVDVIGGAGDFLL